MTLRKVQVKGGGLHLRCRQVGVGKVTAGFTSQRKPWPPADTHHKGTQGPGGNIGAKHSDKGSKQGLAVLPGRPSKPVTHQGSGCSRNPSWLAAGHTAQTQSSCRPPLHPLSTAAGHGRGVEGPERVAADTEGASGVELGGTAGLWGREPRVGVAGPHTPAHSITGPASGLRSLCVREQATRRATGLGGHRQG